MQYLSVFLISIVPFFESYVAIPIGIVFGFPSIQVVLICSVGNWLSAMVFIWLISGLHKRVAGNKDKNSKRKNRAQYIFNKYGVAGLSFAGPFICYHVYAAISIASG